MNFFSHASIASFFSTEGSVALGAMLPDFANLIGAKPPRANCPSVQRGVALHFATDRVFHEVMPFRQACSAEAAALRAQGVARGTALAAAHVALELALDDALAEDEPTRSAFRGALLQAVPREAVASMQWESSEQAARFETLRQRLWTTTSNRPALDASMLTERICRTLIHRPRLAVRAEDRSYLLTWAEGLCDRCASLWPDIMLAVIRGLEVAQWHANPDLVRPLRFRRA